MLRLKFHIESCSSSWTRHSPYSIRGEGMPYSIPRQFGVNGVYAESWGMNLWVSSWTSRVQLMMERQRVQND